jgi:uncharacterized membrane protein
VGLAARFRKRWKTIVSLVGLWLVFMIPIPFLPLWGVHMDQNTINTAIIISAVITIPFTFLAIFMNDGNKGSRTLSKI